MSLLISHICRVARGRGNTTHLLKTAIHNPKVIIVCHNQEYASELNKHYHILLLKQSTWFHFIVWLNRKLGKERSVPLFMSMQDSKGIEKAVRGLNRPIIFDLSCLIE